MKIPKAQKFCAASSENVPSPRDRSVCEDVSSENICHKKRTFSDCLITYLLPALLFKEAWFFLNVVKKIYRTKTMWHVCSSPRPPAHIVTVHCLQSSMWPRSFLNCGRLHQEDRDWPWIRSKSRKPNLPHFMDFVSKYCLWKYFVWHSGD